MAGTSSSGTSNSISSTGNSLKRNSDDVGWEYGTLVDPNNLDAVKCKRCKKIVRGGVYRLKQHVAHVKGNVSACPFSTNEEKAKCLAALQGVKTKKKEKNRHEAEERQEVHDQLTPIDEVSEEVEVGGSKKRSRFLGPMDKFASSIDPESSISKSKNMRQQNINDAIDKERRHDVHRFLARWMYEAGIPFHAIDKDSFIKFVEAVGIYGTGYRPPSQYELREPLLKEEVERTKGELKKQEEEWSKSGCSIMTDAWTDRKRRSIMNLCVNCKEGTTFLSSKEDSEEAHTGPYIFEYVDKCIEEVGPQNVIQVVTDNASNNMAAAKLLKVKRPNIFWTSCAAHTLNLMLQGIGNQLKFKGVIDKAKGCTIFIYAHHKTLAMMRKFTKKRDIVRPGTTRFATSFLTLQSLMEKKNELRAMVTSEEWDKCKHFKSTKGKVAYSTIVNTSFWSGVSLCLKVFAPLVKVLRLVEGETRPSMGFLYGELLQAKKDIMGALGNQENAYRPILEVIDAKAHERLDSPLHLTAYLLNPYYFYKDDSIQHDILVMDGVLECVEKFFQDDLQVQSEVINVDLLKYKNKEGNFGKPIARMGCTNNDENYDPVGWWSNFGNGVPRLQAMARKILSLTTSSSGCERNWSAFEGIHTKKRNRLDATRLNNLVYVQFNAKLINKRKREKMMGIDILLASEASKAQGWIVDGDDEEGEPEEIVGETSGVRELHEVDFESDDTEDEGGEQEDVEFESDTKGILDGYGEELEA